MCCWTMATSSPELVNSFSLDWSVQTVQVAVPRLAFKEGLANATALQALVSGRSQR
jgi:hypothetical protein